MDTVSQIALWDFPFLRLSEILGLNVIRDDKVVLNCSENMGRAILGCHND